MGRWDRDRRTVWDDNQDEVVVTITCVECHAVSQYHTKREAPQMVCKVCRGDHVTNNTGWGRP